MRSTQNPDSPEPITVYGLHHAGPIELSTIDGTVHSRRGKQGPYLDRPRCDDLIHALMEAPGGTR